jgi:hypothetical protein
MPTFDNFELNLVSALADQLIAAFATLTPAPLSQAELAPLPKGDGIYQLFDGGNLVYVGKADSLPKRLLEHRDKIAGRRNISIDDMAFSCLYLHKNWTTATLAPETSLIKFYRKSKTGDCAWNGLSVGRHDPGRDRETTNKPPDGFDARYPIKEHWPCPIKGGRFNGSELLMSVKAVLPFVFRYETTNPKRWREGHPDYNQRTLEVPDNEMGASEPVVAIAQQMAGWQATVFSSHIILYKEDRTYKYGKVIWPA